MDSSYSSRFTQTKMPSKDIVLYAKWDVEIYTITFESNGGSHINTLELAYNEIIPDFTTPIKEGFSFLGWFKDSQFTEEISYTTMPQANLILYAKWEINQYSLTFNSNGGTEISTVELNYNDVIPTIINPEKEGYNFDGWFIDDKYQEAFESTTMPAKDLILYAKWSEKTPKSYFNYTSNLDGIIIKELREPGLTEVYIPQEINGRPVVAIDNTFYNYQSIEYVYIPDGVKTIGANSFKYCNNLKNVRIPDSVTAIEPYAFYFCSSLESIELPPNLRSIGDYAFYHCEELISINLTDQDNLKSIGSYAFDSCYNLTDQCIIIPSSVDHIGEFAFNYIFRLVLISLSESKPVNWSNDWNNRNRSDSETYFTTYYLGDNIFDNGEYIYTISDNSVSIIYGYKNIETIVLPDKINDYPVTTIGKEAFMFCNNLKSITFPNTLTTIEDYAFNNCRSLESLNLPDSLLSIGKNAFEACYGLRDTLVNIPKNIDYIGDNVFYSTYRILLVCPFETAPTNWSSEWDKLSDTRIHNIYYLSYDEVSDNGDFIYIVSNNTITIIYGRKDIETLVIPSEINGIQVTAIGIEAFRSCELLTTVTFPNTLTSIGNDSFSQCKKLNNVILPENLISLGDGAFSGCDILTNIYIPNSITSINAGTFTDCDSLTTINLPENLTYIGRGAFMRSNIKTITIPDSVTTIAEHAFSSCKNLETITLSNSLTSLGRDAFYWCENLQSITLPNTLTTIEDFTFSLCTSLTSITLPENLSSISQFAFADSTSLTSIYIPSSVLNMERDVFKDCTSLTIYCEASSQPAGWVDTWNSSNRPVVWSYIE